ncbi:MAG: mannosyl-3-phosphoglycerate phosphatase [Phycisphaerae bacterium]|nr:mannosyl-3-phosphoglycerate phosphatase [Phycisphaerae bacterium]
MTRPIIFTDLDGTLLDFSTYTPDEARSSVARLQQENIPIIFCSSKTRREQEPYRTHLNISDPFIVENGSAILIPHQYFTPPIPEHKRTEAYVVIELGNPAEAIRHALAEIRRETNLTFDGFSDLTEEAVRQITGLSPAQANAARAREYSETIVTSLSNLAREKIATALTARGYQLLSGGRFLTVTSAQTDKGRAVTLLTHLYRQRDGKVTALGIGDSRNDAALFAAVDHAYQVQKPDGTWEPIPDLAIHRVPAIGPAGWNWVAENCITQKHPFSTRTPPYAGV